jgi:hypothetical protein
MHLITPLQDCLSSNYIYKNVKDFFESTGSLNWRIRFLFYFFFTLAACYGI